jgi:hypothetical protein
MLKLSDLGIFYGGGYIDTEKQICMQWRTQEFFRGRGLRQESFFFFWGGM